MRRGPLSGDSLRFLRRRDKRTRLFTVLGDQAMTVGEIAERLGLVLRPATDFLDTLGIGVSESDLRLNDVECGSPLLRG